MHSVFNGLLSNFGDGNARVLVAQARPTPLRDRNGREPHAQLSTSPSKANLKKVIADQANQLEKKKKIRTENYNKPKRLNAEAPEDGSKKKAATGQQQAHQAQVPGPAKGYLIRTRSVSDDESDFEVEFETAPVTSRACGSASLSHRHCPK